MHYPNSHAFIKLDKGFTHYRSRSRPGETGKQVIVLIHGATVPMWEYDRLVPYLVENGFHCLQFDLYGHGYSDRPHDRYDIDLFVEQLSGFLLALNQTTPVNIIGHSLGAAVAAAFCDRFPDRVKRLVLCAPLIDFESNSASIKLLKIPLLGPLLMRSFVLPMLIRRRARRYHELGHGNFPQMFKHQLLKPGFSRALLALIRSGTLADKLPLYQSSELVSKPVLLVRANEDEIISQAQFDTLREILPSADVTEPAGAGHAVLLTNPELVVDKISLFLRQ